MVSFFLCGLSAHGRQLKCFPDGEYFVDLRLNEINKHKRKKIKRLLKTEYIDPCDYCGRDYDSEELYASVVLLNSDHLWKERL